MHLKRLDHRCSARKTMYFIRIYSCIRPQSQFPPHPLGSPSILILILNPIIRLISFLVRTEVPLRGDMDLFRRDTLIFCLFLTDQSFRLQRSHTSRSGRRDGLSVFLILDITRRKDTFDGCLRGTRDSSDVSIFVQCDLALDEGSGGFVSDGVEQTVDLEILLLSRLDILDLERLEEVSITFALCRDGLSSLAPRTRRMSGRGNSRSRGQ